MKFNRRHIAGLALCAALALPPVAAASAEDCSSLRILNKIDLEMDGNTALVPVKITGQPLKLMLDTGGHVSQLSRPTVKALHLREWDSDIKLYDLTGNVSKTLVTVHSLESGYMNWNRIDFMIEPDPAFPYDGLLALDFLRRYDVELDFQQHRMNYFSPDHCEGRVVYWPAQATAVVPIKLMDAEVRLPVVIDGHTLTAVIDTGADNTSMSLSVAKNIFGIDSATLSPSGAVNGDDATRSYRRAFSTLSFEGITVQHPNIDIIDDRIGTKDRDNDMVLGSRAQRESDLVKQAQLLIGMNILTKLHLYIAFKEEKIYITPSGTPKP